MQDQFIDINLEERERDINKLTRGVREVGDLFTDISLLVTYQGDNIDNIETNIQNTFNNIEKANIQLDKIKKYKQKRRNCCIRIACIGLFIITFFVIIIILSN